MRASPIGFLEDVVGKCTADSSRATMERKCLASAARPKK